MLKLIEVNEQNWMEIARLSVSKEQRGFLDSAVGILARGYAYRSCRARVIGIADDGTVVGVALVKDLDEEPACYDLQQFMVDERYQGKGFGSEALRLILCELERERKYDCVEVCVKRADTAALHVYEKAGFRDTGYVDEEAPGSINLMLHFGSSNPAFSDSLISDFCDPAFRAAFREYFSELNVSVSDWDRLFVHMNEDGGNLAWLRIAQDGGVIGFIQYKPITFTSWFFEETCGLIREFWISPQYRNCGHGAALLRLAEKHFKAQGICTAILTTDTAEGFYRRHGYHSEPGCRAKNGDPVFIKSLI